MGHYFCYTRLKGTGKNIVYIRQYDSLRRCDMKTYYFTITGLNYRYGDKFIEPGMEVKLVKEPDNEYDQEAIKVELPGLGTIGYVANSTHTVIGESHSAGYYCDKLVKGAVGKVLYVLPAGVLCSIDEKYLGKSTKKKSKKKIDDLTIDI